MRNELRLFLVISRWSVLLPLRDQPDMTTIAHHN